MKTKSFWIPGVVFAAAIVLATREGSAPKAVGYFLLAETALFALAFLVAALLGGPGRVLALGTGLGVGLAICSAVLLGEDCDEDSFEIVHCISPGDAFGLGLLAALFFSPGWAIGAIAGAQKRLGRRRSEQPSP